MEDALVKSGSIDEFLNHLKNQEIESYERNGKLTGVWYNNRKYRFGTVGVDKQQIKKLEEEMEVDKTTFEPPVKNLLQEESEIESSIDDVVVDTGGVQDMDALVLHTSGQQEEDVEQDKMTPEESHLRDLQQIREDSEDLTQDMDIEI